MAESDNFETNYKYLVQQEAIPDIGTHHISEHVRQAIADLTQPEMDTLVGLAKKTKSHLFLHDKDNHVIAMGL